MSKKSYEPCPICNSPVDISFSPDGNYINCYRCGEYITSRTALATKPSLNELQVANLSGWLREHQRYEIDSSKWEQLLALKTPTIGEKAIKLLKYFASEWPLPGQEFYIDYFITHYLEKLSNKEKNKEEIFKYIKKGLPLLSITWTQNDIELRYIIFDYLEEQGYLTRVTDRSNRFKITAYGWEFLENLKYIEVDSQIAFVAMWFDDSMNDLYNSIEKSIIDAGYEPKRVDKTEHINKIDDEIIALIRQSKFIVADYTDQRAGVYFESGFALGLNLPVVWICREDEIDNLHFDTNHYNFLTWEEDKLPEFEEKLKNRILAVLGHGTYNPE